MRFAYLAPALGLVAVGLTACAPHPVVRPVVTPPYEASVTAPEASPQHTRRKCRKTDSASATRAACRHHDKQPSSVQAASQPGDAKPATARPVIIGY